MPPFLPSDIRGRHICKIEASTFFKAPRSGYIRVTLLSQYFGEVKVLTEDAALATPPEH
jgi:hypothetical protein